jgi:hypothetical protein
VNVLVPIPPRQSRNSPTVGARGWITSPTHWNVPVAVQMTSSGIAAFSDFGLAVEGGLTLRLTLLLPPFARRFELPVPFVEDRFLTTLELGLWRDVANGAMQAHGIVMLDVPTKRPRQSQHHERCDQHKESESQVPLPQLMGREPAAKQHPPQETDTPLDHGDTGQLTESGPRSAEGHVLNCCWAGPR